MRLKSAVIGAASALAAVFVAPAPACAQNTSGVSSPVVTEGDTSFGYRVAFAPAHDGHEDAFAHRLHFQHALTDSLRLRLVGSMRHRTDRPLDFSTIGAEARWQVVESERHGWDGGLIFQLAIPASAGNPDRFKVGLPVLVDVTARWRAQAVFYTGFEFGDMARDGALMEFRTETTYEILDGVRVGPQYFADFNTTAAPGAFDDQDHQLGFVVKGDLSNRLSYETGALFGLSGAASDADLRLFLNYAF